MNTRLLSVVVPFGLLTSWVRAEMPPVKQEASTFTRFVEDETGARLQTGIGSYRNQDGVIVDLVGAIHIGDKAYYQNLNERFSRYEVLLYEMVGESFEKRKKWTEARGKLEAAIKQNKEKSKPAPKTLEDRVKAIEAYITQAEPGKDARAQAEMTARQLAEADVERAAASNTAWLHPLYEMMEKSLALTGQLGGIDYTKPNFVHADMTAQQFAESQKKKGESFLKLWWNSMKSEMMHPDTMPQQPGLLKILEILCRKDSATELKRIVARVFGSMEGALSALDGEDGSVIVTERNKVALDVMQQQIKLGKKNIGIFYGAAHLRDMEKRLLAMGFTRTGNEWMTAWDLPPEASAAQSGTVKDSANGK